MKAIIYLTATSLPSNGPHVDHPGASGVPYRYTWSTRHQRHILDGRELTAAELDKVAPDIFGAEKGHRVPLPRLVPDDEAEPSTATRGGLAAALDEPSPAVVQSVFDQCTLKMLPEDRRRLGFKLVNDTRPSRAGKPAPLPAARAARKPKGKAHQTK